MGLFAILTCRESYIICVGLVRIIAPASLFLDASDSAKTVVNGKFFRPPRSMNLKWQL